MTEINFEMWDFKRILEVWVNFEDGSILQFYHGLDDPFILPNPSEDVGSIWQWRAVQLIPIIANQIRATRRKSLK